MEKTQPQKDLGRAMDSQGIVVMCEWKIQDAQQTRKELWFWQEKVIDCPYNVIFCRLESCLVRSLQAHSLRQQLTRIKGNITTLKQKLFIQVGKEYKGQGMGESG